MGRPAQRCGASVRAHHLVGIDNLHLFPQRLQGASPPFGVLVVAQLQHRLRRGRLSGISSEGGDFPGSGSNLVQGRLALRTEVDQGADESRKRFQAVQMAIVASVSRSGSWLARRRRPYHRRNSSRMICSTSSGDRASLSRGRIVASSGTNFSVLVRWTPVGSSWNRISSNSSYRARYWAWKRLRAASRCSASLTFVASLFTLAMDR